MTKVLKYQIALSMVPGIGHIGAKKLIAYCGGAEAVFKEKRQHLIKIPGIGEKIIKKIFSADTLKAAEDEIEYIESNGVKAHFYLDKTYPQRLSHCEDGPILLYSKGDMDLNTDKMISIVGTRNATVKGKAFCEKLIEELQVHAPTIISGLAYGIDITAHKAAVSIGLSTIGVLASGLDEVYPKAHYNIANKMQENGGIVSDYRSKTRLLRMQFVERNRIVAGMSDAVIVIESPERGGSLITADMANGYNRDVFALPGRINDSQSIGCNRLIKSNKAALIESAKDIEYIMGWERTKKEKPKKQIQLFHDLKEEERTLLNAFKDQDQLSMDLLSLKSSLSISKTATLLLELEFKGLIQSLPGKIYQRL